MVSTNLAGFESARFTLVSVAGLLVDLSVAYIFTIQAGISLSIAAILGFSSGAVFNYVLHELWTFQRGVKQLSNKRAVRYLGALTATLLVRLGIIGALSVLFDPNGHELPILIAATGVSFIANYLASKLLVFRPVILQKAQNMHETDIRNGAIARGSSGRYLDQEGWQVPSFEESLYGDTLHSYALVIPVINEGERIRQQLQIINNGNLPVDIIIADGGSTDDSLSPGFMKSVGVRAVLTKTGPGKLSAQLRIAYSWCLRQSYRGIVTIDGNGKDGVEAVRVFVEKLEQGYDYIQGSRYCEGGLAENTPLERTIGNRLIHAPLLSLAGNNWLTDTTNGFRAYSARYLLDSEVAPFRDVFMRYELLFYLTVRAGQLGYRVCEVPVRRSYPAGQATPTKITGSGAKIELLKQTIQTALGKFSP